MSAVAPSRPLTVTERAKEPLRRLRGGYRLLTAPWRALPSAVIIGTQRGGSTSLFNYLVDHPDVLPPLGKEIHYFDFHYADGVKWYHGRFPYNHQLSDGKITIDATPYYMIHPLVPERVAKLLPDVKLIAVLRNPIDRALSQYQHEVRGGREPLSFEEAIDRETERIAGEEERLRREPFYYSFNHHRYSYALRGRYVEQLRRWLQYFPREQLMVVQSEWMYREPAAATTAVHRFLGIRPFELERYEATAQQGNYERVMPAKLRQRLADYFEPYNRELYQLLGEEFDWA